MLAIKLQRVGKKHQPSYRLVVALKKSKMAAPPVEDLGSYNAFTKLAAFRKERIAYWMKVGAQPTITVHNLLVGQGILTVPKRAVKIKKAKVEAETPAEASVSAAAATPTAAATPAEAEPAGLDK